MMNFVFCPEGKMDYRNRYDEYIYGGGLIKLGHYGTTEKEYNFYKENYGIVCPKQIRDIKLGKEIMLTESYINKLLDMGKEVYVECIDSLGFIRYPFQETNIEILNEPEIVIVSNEHNGTFALRSGQYVLEEELKYFKVKTNFTIYDLLDAVIQAHKDLVIQEFSVKGTWIYVKHNGATTGWGENEVTKGLSFIESLYIKEFVINATEDIEKIREGDTIRLLNGNEFTVHKTEEVRISAYGSVDILSLVTLKGATVLQSTKK